MNRRPMGRAALAFAQLRVLAAHAVVRQAATLGVFANRYESFRVVALAGVVPEHLWIS